jgi:hypothetical protein
MLSKSIAIYVIFSKSDDISFEDHLGAEEGGSITYIRY